MRRIIPRRLMTRIATTIARMRAALRHSHAAQDAHGVSTCTNYAVATAWPPFAGGPTRSYAAAQPVTLGAMRAPHGMPRSFRRVQH